MQGLESHFNDESNSCFMVVFQYGSVVLFNIADHEVDGYLKIVQKHASGLLSETKKDGKVFQISLLCDLPIMSGLISIVIILELQRPKVYLARLFTEHMCDCGCLFAWFLHHFFHL